MALLRRRKILRTMTIMCELIIENHFAEGRRFSRLEWFFFRGFVPDLKLASAFVVFKICCRHFSR